MCNKNIVRDITNWVLLKYAFRVYISKPFKKFFFGEKLSSLKKLRKEKSLKKGGNTFLILLDNITCFILY